MATSNLPTGSEIPGAPKRAPGGWTQPYYQGSDGRWYIWRMRSESQGGPVWVVQDLDPREPGGGGIAGVGSNEIYGEDIPEDAPSSPNKPAATKPDPGPAAAPKAARYPSDMSIGRDTDYVMFEFYDYTPPFKKNDVSRRANAAAESQTFNQTLGDYNSNRGQAYTKSVKLPQLILYMPDDVSDTFKADWEGKAVGAGTAGILAAAGAQNKLDEGLKQIASGLGRLPVSQAAKAIQSLASNVGGDALGVDDVFGGISGVIRNPNTEILFQKMNLRTFNLKFKLVPYNANDVAAIGRIIKSFKTAMLPKYQITDAKVFGYSAGDNAALQGGFIQVPNLCQVTYMQGGSKHTYLPTYKKCAITDFKVNYTPDNNYATLTNSFPVAVEIDVAFLETKLVFAEDVDPNIVLDVGYNKDGEYIGTTRPDGATGGGSDIRLKENIVKVGNSPSGLNLYEWNYIGYTQRYRGVMAQEIMDVKPEAVFTFNRGEWKGYFGVNYSQLDVNMEEVN